MSKSVGRLCVVKLAGVLIAGLKTNSITVAKTPIDISDKSTGANLALLDGAIQSQTLEISGEGLEDSQVLRDLALDSSEGAGFLTDLTYEFANGDIISGNFFFGNYTEGAPHNDASTFTGTFTSHGGWTYTPAA